MVRVLNWYLNFHYEEQHKPITFKTLIRDTDEIQQVWGENKGHKPVVALEMKTLSRLEPCFILLLVYLMIFVTGSDYTLSKDIIIPP
jgi:hypothetical protein